MAALRKRQEANAINLKVEIDKRSLATAEGHLKRIETTYKMSDSKRAFRIQVMVAGAASLPALAKGALSAASALSDLGRAALVLPGLFASLGLSIGALATGLGGISKAFQASNDAMQNGQQYARQYANATRDLERAQRDVVKALKDANREIQDQRDKLTQGQLSVEQAQLNVLRANEQLARGGFQSMSDWQQAILDQKRAYFDLSQTVKEHNRDVQDYYDNAGRSATQSDTFRSAMDRLADTVEAFNKAQQQASGSSDAFINAMKGMSPAAREFVTEILALKGAWQDVQSSVQANLFDGLGRAISDLAERRLPMLRTGLSQVATGLNLQMKQIMASLGSDQNSDALSRMFARTGDALDRMRPGINSLITATMQLSEAGTRFLPRLSGAFNVVMGRFEAFIARADSDGSLEDWINRGLLVMNKLGDSMIHIGSIFGSLSAAHQKATGEMGGLISTLERGLGRLSDYLASPEGQQALVSYVNQAQDFINSIKDSIPGILKIFKAIADGARQFAEFAFPKFAAIGDWMSKHASAVSQIIALYMVWRTVHPFIAHGRKMWDRVADGVERYRERTAAALEQTKQLQAAVVDNKAAALKSAGWADMWRNEVAQGKAAMERGKDLQKRYVAETSFAMFDLKMANRDVAAAQIAVADASDRVSKAWGNQNAKGPGVKSTVGELRNRVNDLVIAQGRAKDASRNLSEAMDRQAFFQKNLAGITAGTVQAQKNLKQATEQTAHHTRLASAAADQLGMSFGQRFANRIKSARVFDILSGLVTAMGGVVSAIGGVAATAGLIFALDRLSAAHQRAADRADYQRTREEALANTLDQTTGAATAAGINEAVREGQKFQVTGKGNKSITVDAPKAANDLGISTEQLKLSLDPTQLESGRAVQEKADKATLAAVNAGKDAQWNRHGEMLRRRGFTAEDYAKALNGDQAAVAKFRAAVESMFDEIDPLPGLPDVGGLRRKLAENVGDLPELGVGVENLNRQGINSPAVGQFQRSGVAATSQGGAAIQRANTPGRLKPAGQQMFPGAENVMLDPDGQGAAFVMNNLTPAQVQFLQGQGATLTPTGAPGRFNVHIGGDLMPKFVEGFASGGPVWGAGSATSDSIPAMLSNGEFVINAKSASVIGHDRLARLNSFAGGGAVGKPNSDNLDDLFPDMGGQEPAPWWKRVLRGWLGTSGIGVGLGIPQIAGFAGGGLIGPGFGGTEPPKPPPPKPTSVKQVWDDFYDSKPTPLLGSSFAPTSLPTKPVVPTRNLFPETDAAQGAALGSLLGGAGQSPTSAFPVPGARVQGPYVPGSASDPAWSSPMAGLFPYLPKPVVPVVKPAPRPAAPPVPHAGSQMPPGPGGVVHQGSGQPGPDGQKSTQGFPPYRSPFAPHPTPPSAIPGGSPTAEAIASALSGGELPPLSFSERGAQRNTIRVGRAIQSLFPLLGAAGNGNTFRPQDPYPDHPSGEAVDLGLGADFASPEKRAYAQAATDWVIANSDKLGIKYVIWDNKLWYPGGRTEPYGSTGGASDQHLDHLHIRTTGGGLPADGEAITAPAGLSAPIVPGGMPVGQLPAAPAVPILPPFNPPPIPGPAPLDNGVPSGVLPAVPATPGVPGGVTGIPGVNAPIPGPFGPVPFQPFDFLRQIGEAILQAIFGFFGIDISGIVGNINSITQGIGQIGQQATQGSLPPLPPDPGPDTSIIAQLGQMVDYYESVGQKDLANSVRKIAADYTNRQFGLSPLPTVAAPGYADGGLVGGAFGPTFIPPIPASTSMTVGGKLAPTLSDILAQGPQVSKPEQFKSTFLDKVSSAVSRWSTPSNLLGAVDSKLPFVGGNGLLQRAFGAATGIANPGMNLAGADAMFGLPDFREAGRQIGSSSWMDQLSGSLAMASIMPGGKGLKGVEKEVAALRSILPKPFLFEPADVLGKMPLAKGAELVNQSRLFQDNLKTMWQGSWFFGATKEPMRNGFLTGFARGPQDFLDFEQIRFLNDFIDARIFGGSDLINPGIKGLPDRLSLSPWTRGWSYPDPKQPGGVKFDPYAIDPKQLTPEDRVMLTLLGEEMLLGAIHGPRRFDPLYRGLSVTDQVLSKYLYGAKLSSFGESWTDSMGQALWHSTQDSLAWKQVPKGADKSIVLEMGGGVPGFRFPGDANISAEELVLFGKFGVENGADWIGRKNGRDVYSAQLALRSILPPGMKLSDLGKASGGYISGPGGPRDDLIPAMLSNGEFVMNAKAVKQLGVGRLNALNRFADGGPVNIPIIPPPPPPGPLPPPPPAPTGQPTDPAQQTPEQRMQSSIESMGAGLSAILAPKGGGSGGSPQTGSFQPSDPRAILGAAPTSDEHNNPALSAGIKGAWNTIGALAGTAAAAGMGAINGVAPGAGSVAGGAASQLVSAGAQMAGEVASGAVNILSSLLVGTVTPSQTGQGYGAPMVAQPAQPLQSTVINHNENIHTSDLSEYQRLQDRREAQKSMPFMNRT